MERCPTLRAALACMATSFDVKMDIRLDNQVLIVIVLLILLFVVPQIFVLHIDVRGVVWCRRYYIIYILYNFQNRINFTEALLRSYFHSDGFDKYDLDIQTKFTDILTVVDRSFIRVYK